MMDYVLMTDMTCDLNAEELSKYQIAYIPMNFLLNGKEYTHYADQRELSLSDFYMTLKTGVEVKTTQINPVVYQEIFEEHLKAGRDIIYICFTSGMSGTYNTASMIADQLAEEYPERKITVIDSLGASIGLGLLVLLAGKQYVAGLNYDGMIAYIEEMKTRCCHWFTVDDLHQLRRGGRLSSLEAVVGTALKIKPILSVDAEGKLVVVAKERGTKKALGYLLDRLEADGVENEEGVAVVAHANAPELAEYLAGEVRKSPKIHEVVITEIGPIIGSHVGSGMCAMTFVGDNYKF